MNSQVFTFVLIGVFAALIAIGFYVFSTDSNTDVSRFIDQQPATTTPEDTTSELAFVEGWATYATSSLPTNHTLQVRHPQSAEADEDVPGFHQILYAGPQNEDPALTDGFSVTITTQTKAATTSVEAVARQDAPGAVTQERIGGRFAYTYTDTAAMGNEVTHAYYSLDETAVTKVSFSIIAPEERQEMYRRAIGMILTTLRVQLAQE